MFESEDCCDWDDGLRWCSRCETRHSRYDLCLGDIEDPYARECEADQRRDLEGYAPPLGLPSDWGQEAPAVELPRDKNGKPVPEFEIPF